MKSSWSIGPKSYAYLEDIVLVFSDINLNMFK